MASTNTQLPDNWLDDQDWREDLRESPSWNDDDTWDGFGAAPAAQELAELLCKHGAVKLPMDSEYVSREDQQRWERAIEAIGGIGHLRHMSAKDGCFRYAVPSGAPLSKWLTAKAKSRSEKLSDAFDRFKQNAKNRTAAEIRTNVRDRPTRRLNPRAPKPITPPRFAAKSFDELSWQFPELRPPVIHGILRQGETMNIIAPPKAGKSWLVTDLALSITSGRPWLDMFKVERGRVLVIDNELHGETTAARIPKVAAARGIPQRAFGDRLHVDNLRGRLSDLLSMGQYFEDIPAGAYNLIILDAFYRFMPSTESENDNSVISSMFNFLDLQAARIGCSFVCIHHTSKGSQAGKSVTDVGAGAGSQSRAADVHAIIRPHEQDGAAVLDAVVRSWEPIKPLAMRWTFPVWKPAPDLDATQLASSRPRRQPKEGKPKPMKVELTPSEFAETYLDDSPRTKDAIFLASALAPDMSGRLFDRLLKACVSQGLAVESRSGPAKLYARPAAFSPPSNN